MAGDSHEKKRYLTNSRDEPRDEHTLALEPDIKLNFEDIVSNFITPKEYMRMIKDYLYNFNKHEKTCPSHSSL